MVQTALQFMETHLDDPFDLSSLAAALHDSKYHLLHQFAAATGQSAYLQRRRLTEAARRLTDTGLPILQIALSAGYGSQQAFSTRFKAMYKRSPARPGNASTPSSSP